MRLLPKKEIESQRQRERKLEIDEGIKLATSIDEMRRLKADDENNLSQWRGNALRSIRGEIDAYLLERDGYAKEVIELQEMRRSLLEPINEEWRELRIEQEKWERMKQEIVKDMQSVRQERKELEKREKDRGSREEPP